MRPRKVVLCLCADEERLRERCFLLETVGYHALRAQTAAEALMVLFDELVPHVDVLLIDLPAGVPACVPAFVDDALLAQARHLHPALRTLVVSEQVSTLRQADRWLEPGNMHPEAVLFALMLATKRKRGPKTDGRTKKPPERVTAGDIIAGLQRGAS